MSAEDVRAFNDVLRQLAVAPIGAEVGCTHACARAPRAGRATRGAGGLPGCTRACARARACRGARALAFLRAACRGRVVVRASVRAGVIRAVPPARACASARQGAPRQARHHTSAADVRTPRAQIPAAAEEDLHFAFPESLAVFSDGERVVVPRSNDKPAAGCSEELGYATGRIGLIY